MNHHIDMSNFNSDRHLNAENAMQNNSQIKNDFHLRTVEVHDKHIYIDGDQYRHEIPIGMGLTGFCEIEFEKILPILKAEARRNRIHEKETISPKNEMELQSYLNDLAEDSLYLIDSLAQLHPYIECFAPIFLDEEQKGLDYFFAKLYLMKIQFGMIIRQCFDLNYYPEQLAELTATERFYLYAADKDSVVPAPLKQVFLFDSEILEGYKPAKGTVHNKYEMFTEIKPGLVEHVKRSNATLSVGYECSTIYDALNLEFYKMLEMNISVKQCKNCGKYFIVKGKYDNDYCTRRPNGGTQTCQKIAAMASFKDKVSENAPYQIFQKYYKRYHARMKAGTIKEQEFKTWNLKACTMRDECMDGKCDVEKFTVWLEESFPNRGRKK